MENKTDSEPPPNPDPLSFESFGLFTYLFSTAIHPSSIAILLALVIALIVLSALVSASEVAFFSLSADQLKELEEDKTSSSKRVVNLMKRREYLLATILIANNLFNVGIILSSYMLTSSFLDPLLTNEWLKILVETTLITGTLVVFGEVLPKLYAKSNNLRIAKANGLLLTFLSQIFTPLAGWLVSSTSMIQTYLSKGSKGIDYQRLDQAIDLVAKNSGNENELDLLKGVLTFGNLTAKQIMKARVDLVAIDMDKSFNELCELVVESGFSRIPVYKDTIDDIQGLIYAKDLLPFTGKSAKFDWKKLIRTNLLIIPESKKIDDLLQDFREKKMHLALVVDEFGGTMGIVTLEDVLEEVVGEIEDEYDKSYVELLQKNHENEYICDGKTSLLDLSRFMDIEHEVFDEIKGDSDSIGGLLLELNNGFMKKGEKIIFDKFHFTVLSHSANRIKEIKINIRKESNAQTS